MFGCLDVWMFGCLDVWVFGRLDVWTFGRLFNVWTLECLNGLHALDALDALDALNARVGWQSSASSSDKQQPLPATSSRDTPMGRINWHCIQRLVSLQAAQVKLKRRCAQRQFRTWE